MTENLYKLIGEYPDFPKAGIVFRDISPILQEPHIFADLINKMSSSNSFKNAEAIIAIDARGFIFGTAIAIKLAKPMVLVRKPGKLPGELFEEHYELEYGKDSLSIQKDSLNKYKKFAIVDDLLATGGTVKCIADLLYKRKKMITGLSVLVELKGLKARNLFEFPVDSQIIY